MSQKVGNIAIIAGAGDLPWAFYEICQKKRLNCKIIGLKGEVNNHNAKKIEMFAPYEVSKILECLRSRGVENVVLLGKVGRNHIPKLVLDPIGRDLLSKIMKTGLNDSAIFSVITDLLDRNGLKIIKMEDVSDDLITTFGNISKNQMPSLLRKDIEYGIRVLKDVAKHDIGQALVIEKNLILGIEAAEGTDVLIQRCALLKSGNSGVLIKVCKPGQDDRIDLPCIGLNTIKSLIKHNYLGIVLESQKSIILNKPEVIKLANENGLFVYGV